MMTAAFIPARELKQYYHCLGFFYTLMLQNGNRVPCRSVLEILKTETFTEIPPENTAPSHSDALVIMMNPGSSRPLFPNPTGPIVTSGEIGKIKHPNLLVPTVPDPTQYQIVRLMAEQNWHHVRVVNLSDIRNANSNNFIKIVSQLNQLPDGTTHSLFSPERETELDFRIRMNRGPVIAGWGQTPKLEPLAENCVRSMGKQHLFGVQAPGHPLRFAHPSPRNHAQKLKWLAEMNRLLLH